MKLHEAMIEIIDKLGNLEVEQMAWVLNQTNLYTKRDSSEIKTSQIYARVNKYPHLFYIENKKVYRRSNV